MISISLSEKIEGIIQFQIEDNQTIQMPIHFERQIHHSNNKTIVQIRDYVSNTEIIQTYDATNTMVAEQECLIKENI